MRRERWATTGTIALTVAVAIALVTALAGCGERTANNPSGYTVGACAAKTWTPESTGLQGAGGALIPFTPSAGRLCSYHGLPGHDLAADVRLTTAEARALAEKANRSVTSQPGGPINCPAATGANVVATFWNSREHIDLRVDADGCETADNGTQHSAWVALDGLGGYLRSYAGRLAKPAQTERVFMPSACARTAVKPVESGLAGDAKSMIPIVPTQALLCYYNGLNGPKALQLRRSETILGEPAARLAQAIDDGVPPDQHNGTQSCPADFGVAEDFWFSNGAVAIEVAVDPAGCTYLWNGTFAGEWKASAPNAWVFPKA